MTRNATYRAPTKDRTTAAYVAEMAGNLAGLARGSGLDALGFILEMAQMEARSEAGLMEEDAK
jgi:hypothetical protein